jgi:crossover junction endodeoxyribonuclease RuvC
MKPASHTYLGIDPGGRNCALVAFNPNRGVVRTWKPGKDFPDGVRRLSYLIHHIKQQLGAIHDDGGNVVRIAIEGYSMYERFGQHAAGEVGAAIKLGLVGWFGLDNPIGYPIIVAPQQLKKFATGNGNTGKAMIPKEVLKRWGEDFKDENLADAYALARVAYGEAAHPAMTRFQLEVLDALQGRTEWNAKEGQSSSGSPRRPAPDGSRASSRTPSSRAKASSSAPSGRWHLIRPSKQRLSANAS